MQRDVFIGLGSNVGDRLANLSRAAHAIERIPGSTLLAVSRAYESNPWGVTDQPTFANAVAHLRTKLAADQLLEHLQGIEDEMGRRRDVRYGPRIIDLDILLFGDEEWDSPELTIPHPHMTEREFVVRPLLDLAPWAALPDGTSITLDRARVGRIIGVLGAVSDFPPPVCDEEVGPGRASSSGARYGVSEDEDWVEVAASSLARIDRAPDIELLFIQTVLEAEGIPYVWYPNSPIASTNPWGIGQPPRLLVPARLRELAMQIIADAESATPQIEPEEFESPE